MNIRLGIALGMLRGGMGGGGLLPFSDDFSAANPAWTGATWSVAGGVATNTPTLGAELVSNPEFATDTTGWAAQNSATLTRRDFTVTPDIDPTGGSDNFGLEVANGGVDFALGLLNVARTGYRWLDISGRAFAPSGNTAVNSCELRFYNGIATALQRIAIEDSWQSLQFTTREGAPGGNNSVQATCRSTTIGDVAYFDNVSAKALTLDTLFRTIDPGISDVSAQVEITRTAGTQAGLVLCLDSAGTPAYFVIIYLDGTGNVVVVKCVNGVYSVVSSTAVSYSAGAALKCVKSGTSFVTTYNGLAVATDTISDAGIVDNTIVGKFSTYISNSFDNFNAEAA